MDKEEPQLDYPKARSWPTQRRWLVVVICATVVFAALILGDSVRPLRQLMLLHYQKRCLNAVGPSQPVYVSRSLPEAEKLAGKPKGIGIYPLPRPQITPMAAFDCWTRFKSMLPALSSNPPEYPIFVHERVSPSGHVRLVAIHATILESLRIGQYAGTTLEVNVNLRPQVIVPGTFAREPTEVGHRLAWSGIQLSSKRQVRLFTGQADARYLDRFTIKCIVDDEVQIWQGWLLDDDTVRIEFQGVIKGDAGVIKGDANH